MLEREREIAIRLLITGSGVQIPYNPLFMLLSHSKIVSSIFSQPILNYAA